MTKSTILLTGFGPFGEHQTNPTEKIVVELNNTTMNDYFIKGAVLPVSFDRAYKELKKLIQIHAPSIVLALGLAADRKMIEPELVALNYQHAKITDCDGLKKTQESIDPNTPNALFSTLPVFKIVERLNENSIEARVSTSAGTYVCNRLMYDLLNDTQNSEMQLNAGFIHVPFLEHELLMKQIKLCISCITEN